MRIYQLALILLTFSLVGSMYNELGIFEYQVVETEFGTNSSDISGIIDLDDTERIESEDSYKEEVSDIGGIEMLAKVWNVVANVLKNTLLIGEVFKQYVPGEIGAAFGNIFTAVTWLIYSWGLIQLKLKVGTKGMD